jgi:hypothetical protein
MCVCVVSCVVWLLDFSGYRWGVRLLKVCYEGGHVHKECNAQVLRMAGKALRSVVHYNNSCNRELSTYNTKGPHAPKFSLIQTRKSFKICQ